MRGQEGTFGGICWAFGHFRRSECTNCLLHYIFMFVTQLCWWPSGYNLHGLFAVVFMRTRFIVRELHHWIFEKFSEAFRAITHLRLFFPSPKVPEGLMNDVSPCLRVNYPCKKGPNRKEKRCCWIRLTFECDPNLQAVPSSEVAIPNKEKCVYTTYYVIWLWNKTNVCMSVVIGSSDHHHLTASTTFTRWAKNFLGDVYILTTCHRGGV